MRCDAWAGALSWWSCQSPLAHSCSLLNHLNTFYRGMLKLNAKNWCRFVALLAQSFWMQWPHSTHAHSTVPLTSTVNLSLFTHVHSRPLSLAARLHWCHANPSYINNGCFFSRQTSYAKRIFQNLCIIYRFINLTGALETATRISGLRPRGLLEILLYFLLWNQKEKKHMCNLREHQNKYS